MMASGGSFVLDVRLIPSEEEGRTVRTVASIANVFTTVRCFNASFLRFEGVRITLATDAPR
jgi:hypothetical protein